MSYWIIVASKDHLQRGLAGGFIQDKAHWGAPFRFGTLQIPEQDFHLIAGRMVEDQSLLDK